MAKWLITGGNGFIGRNLIVRLARSGEEIRILDNCSVCGAAELGQVCEFEHVANGSRHPLGGMAQLIRGDIRNAETCRDACAGMDFVAHLAANTGVPKSVQNPELDFQSNVLGTFQMLEAAREAGIKRFIFASSGAPAGTTPPPVTELSPARPISPYGASKLAGEGYCSAFYHCYGLETVALRFSNVYGPWSGHKTSVVAKLINAALAGGEWQIYGDGSQTRDFLYVDDLVSAICLAASVRDIGGEVFQISTGKEHSLLDLIAVINDALKARGIAPAAVCNEAPRAGDMKRNYADPAKAAMLLGWRAERGLREGIGDTIAWFLDRRQSQDKQEKP